MATVRSLVLVLAAGLGLLTGSAGAAAQTDPVVQAQSQLDQAQVRLGALNDQVERAQAGLDAANRQLALDQERQAQIDRELSDIARFQYTEPALPILVFRAGSLRDAIAEVNEWRVVGGRESALLAQQKALRARDQKSRDAIAADLKTVQDAQAQAQRIALQAQAGLSSAQAQAYRQVQAQALATAAVAVAPSGPVPTSGPNHFSYGYCTWYVANRRYIPWFGNAIEWWPNARAYGYLEGQTPQVGAVMVTRESSAGHVAYVESVNADGSWTVSEMNYVAWGVVSRRTIRYGQVPLVGFIYGHA